MAFAEGAPHLMSDHNSAESRGDDCVAGISAQFVG